MAKKARCNKFIIVLLVFAVISSVVFACASSGVAYAAEDGYARDAMPPVITVSPKGGEGVYYNKVTVSIAWNNDNSYKYYSVKEHTGFESGKLPYRAPFEIKSGEGHNEIYAYYYDAEGVLRHTVEVIDYIDATPPVYDKDLTSKSNRVEIDLKSSDPMKLIVRARDMLSGINRVYVQGLNKDFTLSDPMESEYSVSCEGLLDGVNVIMEDNAGNVSVLGYSLSGYDRNMISEYAAKYKSLNRDIYTESALKKIDEAFDNLSFALENPDEASSLSYRIAVDKAIDTLCAVDVVYTSTSSNIPTGADITMKYGDSNRLAGDNLVLKIGEVKAEDIIAGERRLTAESMSGYRNPVLSSFSLDMVIPDGDLIMYREVELAVNMPFGTDAAKIYIDNDGALEMLRSEIRDGRFIFYTKSFGDFYLVADIAHVGGDGEKGLTIAGKFYPAKTLGIAGGIVGAIMILGGVGTFVGMLLVNKRR